MKRGVLRWGLCAALVVALHGAALWFSLGPRPVAVEDDAGAPVLTVDLDSALATPVAASDEAETDPAKSVAPGAPVAPAPLPPDSPSPKPDASQPMKPDPAAEPIPTPAEVSRSPPTPNPTPAPEPAEPQTPATLLPPPGSAPGAPRTAAAFAADRIAEAPMAPTRNMGSEDEVSASIVRRWRQDLIARIERRKRYPSGAQGRGGRVEVAFDLNGEGRLGFVRIVESSGSPALDAAALDLIRRAAPFPPPPAGLSVGSLSFVAPIHYFGAAR